MSENIFAYTAVDSGYTVGVAGAINGDRAAASSSFQAVKNKISGLNTDPAFFNFFQGNNSRLVLRQYTYSTTTLLPNKVLAPQGNWSTPLAVQKWSAVPNLHGVATNSEWLFAIGYDLSKIAVIDMTGDSTGGISYSQKNAYAFPADFSAFTNPYNDGTYHGEALTVVGNSLYALFYVNKGTGSSTYYDSVIAKFEIDPDFGELTFVSYVKTGKNSFTLDLYNNKLYVCSLGGMQQGGAGNTDTKLSIVDLADFTQAGVTDVTLSNPTVNGDFRDISIMDDSHAYVFIGHYNDSSYSAMVGGIYYTTIANLTTPTSWIKVFDVNAGGYLWGIYKDSYRLWFIKGTPLDIFDGAPTTLTTTASKSFDITSMSDFTGGSLNSACFIAVDQTTKHGLETVRSAKSLASHLRLASEVRQLAEKLEEEK